MKPARILIADDDASIAKLILAITKREGYESVLVNDGKAAVKALRQEKFDLVICDQTMPYLTGAEVASWMRQSEKNFDTPFVLMTADHNPTLFSSLINNAKIDSYLPKPASFTQITTHLKMMVKMRIIHQKEEPESVLGEFDV